MASRPILGLLAASLLASAALNVRLLTTKAPPAAARPAPSAAGGPPTPMPFGPSSSVCERRLSLCQQNAFALAQRAARADQAPPPTEGTGGSRGGSGPAEQAAALCAKAEEGLRAVWRRDRDGIAAVLTKSLADRDEQAKSVKDEVAKMREAAALDDREASALESAYGERRLARMAEAQAALAKQPQDFAAVLESARGLYADEDAILERIGGAGARDAWRASQLEGRTVVLAIGAAMAEKDFDDSIRW